VADDPTSRDRGAPVPESVRMRMRSRRGELGLSIRDVAEATGISRSILSRIETGDNVRADLNKLSAIAGALSWDVATLIGVAKDAAPSEATLLDEIAGPAEVGTYRTPQARKRALEAAAETIPVTQAPEPRDPRLKQRRRLIVPVNDDQLAGLGLPSTARHTAFVAAGSDVPMESDGVYLVNRDGADGTETTFRRLAVYPDRYEFALMSSDPDLNAGQLIVIGKDDLASSPLKISGMFYGVTSVYC
jgi:transcriptional regulator with XRE-family HTH domain